MLSTTQGYRPIGSLQLHENSQVLGEAPARPVALIRDFFTQLTDPTMVPAFLAGGMAYRLVRFGAAGKWVTAPAVKTLTGLFARQLGASTLALGAEAAVFTGAHRAALSLSSTHPAPNASFSHETAGTALMLGSLRSFAFGTGILGGMLQRAGLAWGASPVLLSQLGAYTGLLTSQKLEHALLNPDRPAPEHPWLQAAVSLIHFNGFNAVAGHLTPKAWQQMEHRLEQKTLGMVQEKTRQIREGSQDDFGTTALAWKTADNLSVPEAQIPIYFSKAIARPDGVGLTARLSPNQRLWAAQLFQNLSVGQTQLFETLAQSRFVRTEDFDLALQRLHHVSLYSQREGARSSYINWITRLGFEGIIEKGDVEALDQMITMITQPTPRLRFEAFLSGLFPSFRLPPPPPPSARIMSALLRKKNPTQSGIETLPLNDRAKMALRRTFSGPSHRESSAGFLIPETEFLGLLANLNALNDLPKWQLAERILDQAGSGPLGGLKIYRLYQILKSEMAYDPSLGTYRPRGWLGTKLRELGDDNFYFAGRTPLPVKERERNCLGALGGYLGYHGPRELVRALLNDLNHLLDPHREQSRRDRRHQVLRSVLRQYPGPAAYDRQVMAKAFGALSQAFKGENWEFNYEGLQGDFSFHVARDLQRNLFAMKFVTEAQFLNFDREIHEAAYREYPGYRYQVPITIPRGKMIVWEGRPLMLVVVPSGGTRQAGHHTDPYFEMMTTVVHEWMHAVQDRHYSQKPDWVWSEGVQLKQEAATHTAHYWFKAQHGDASELRLFSTEGLGGYMMRFLDHYEAIYQKYWRD